MLSPPAATGIQATAGRRGNGWLSDLLAKVDRDDAADAPQAAEATVDPTPTLQPASPTAPVAAPSTPVPATRPSVAVSGGASGALSMLDAVASDISRLLHESVLIEMWDRFRKGERDVFTMRLYTAAGQESFEAIRRLHASDRDFRDTVRRYIQEFERLLAEAGREARDGARVRTIIVSNTGKVYTLLAHASGRLG